MVEIVGYFCLSSPNQVEMNLSEHIRQAREDRRLRKSDVAKLLNTDASNYNKLEQRGNALTIIQATEIAEALGMDLIELLTYGSEPKQEKADQQLTEQVIGLQARLGRLSMGTTALVATVREALELPPEQLKEFLTERLESEEVKQLVTDSEDAMKFVVDLLEALALVGVIGTIEALRRALEKSASDIATANARKRLLELKLKLGQEGKIPMTPSDTTTSPAR